MAVISFHGVQCCLATPAFFLDAAQDAALLSSQENMRHQARDTRVGEPRGTIKREDQCRSVKVL